MLRTLYTWIYLICKKITETQPFKIYLYNTSLGLSFNSVIYFPLTELFYKPHEVWIAQGYKIYVTDFFVVSPSVALVREVRS